MKARAKTTRKRAPASSRARSKAPAAKRVTTKRWSKQVTETSNAMELEPAVFNKKTPRAIASSLKRSADRSQRRKASPFQSAMSMLNFYINRGGSNLTGAEKQKLERAKLELRALYRR